MGYAFLTLAIIAEVVATSSLKYTDQFTRFGPSLIVIIGYACSFFFLSLTLKELNLGIAYAIWCAAGIACIGLIQHFWFKQTLDVAAVVGITLIIFGVAVINLFPNSIHH